MTDKKTDYKKRRKVARRMETTSQLLVGNI
jgi:hypothetical protein